MHAVAHPNDLRNGIEAAQVFAGGIDARKAQDRRQHQYKSTTTGVQRAKTGDYSAKNLEGARESGGHYRIAAHLRAGEIRRLASLSARLSAQNRAARRASTWLPLLHQDPPRTATGLVLSDACISR